MRSQLKPNPKRWLKGQILTRVHGMITCREFEDFVLSYLDDELTPAQNRVFKTHLLVCRECRDYLNAYQRSTELTKELLQEPTAHNLNDVPEDLIHAILAAKKS